MYKIQIGFEDGYFVAYLALHSEYELEAEVLEEIENMDLDTLIHEIPDRWKELLTSFKSN